MKRIVSLVLCMALAIGTVTYKPPQAKAVVLEATSAVALVGIFLTAMGLYWAYDNYQSAVAGAPVTKFGSNLAEELDEYIYEKTGEHRNVIEVMFHGDPDMGPNFGDDLEMIVGTVVTVSAAAVASISAFGKWLYDKYALAENESAVVYSDGFSFSYDAGYFSAIYPVSVCATGLLGSTSYNTVITLETVLTEPGVYSYNILSAPSSASLYFYPSKVQMEIGNRLVSTTDGKSWVEYSASSVGNTYYWNVTDSDISKGIKVLINLTASQFVEFSQGQLVPINSSVSVFGLSDSPPYSLSVSAPNGLNLPDTDALPEGQGFALEFPDIIADDFPSLLEQAVPQVLTNPEYVPTLNPTEITNPDPMPNPDGEEVPEPAPAGATIIDYLVDIWRKIKALPETIPNGIKKAFEPDPELVTEITTTFTDKFGWLETIHQLGLDLCGLKPGSEPPVIFIHLEDATGKYNYGGTEKALDMSWYEPYKKDVDNIISGFMWLAFLWLVFKRAADIINGAGMVSDYEFYGSHPIDQPRLEEHKK